MKSIKLGCFILHSYSLWKALEEDVSDCILILFGKLLRRRGAMGLVSWCLDLKCRSS
jgi:hypothetical protein